MYVIIGNQPNPQNAVACNEYKKSPPQIFEDQNLANVSFKTKLLHFLEERGISSLKCYANHLHIQLHNPINHQHASKDFFLTI